MFALHQRARIGLALVFGLALLACEGGVPAVRQFGSVVPHLSPPSDIRPRSIPSVEAKSLEQGKTSSGSCLDWQTVREEVDPETGEFDYFYRCAEGGDIASIRSTGVDRDDGTGHYETVYQMRDGQRQRWVVDYRPDPIDTDTVRYSGRSDDGATFEGTYRAMPSGETYLREVYRYPELRIEIEGLSSDDGRFNGSMEVDDLRTPLSPDSTLVQVEKRDGTVEQRIQRTEDGWGIREELVLSPQGDSTYSFRYDELATEVSPDYQGSYRFTPLGSGQGQYRQTFDDGSHLDVEQIIDADGSYLERWTFDDALTEPDVEQRGELDYDGSGYAAGTVTTYVIDGGAETCRLTIYPNGGAVIDQCRQGE